MRLSENDMNRVLDSLAQSRFENPEEISAIERLLYRSGAYPEIRHELVRDIKQAVDEHVYVVPSEEVARMIIVRCFAGMLR